jgi:cell division protein FtsN
MTNSTLDDLILDFNPEINNANLIQVNQKLRIPKITKEWLIDEVSDHTYRLHVGTFWAPDFAKRYRDESALKGKRVEILPRKVSPNDTWFRVMVGPFDNKDEALKMIDLLKEKGLLPLFGGTLKAD